MVAPPRSASSNLSPNAPLPPSAAQPLHSSVDFSDSFSPIDFNPNSPPHAVISAVDPDWSREAKSRWWEPNRQLLQSIRQYQRWRSRRSPWAKLLCNLAVCQHRFWSAITGADIPINCQLGGGLMLPHPNGVVIHPEAHIGPNCLIFQQVTITRQVHIGGHVDIGAGAKIIRPVTIGDHARIGANAVVLSDVPPGATVVGIPARIVSQASV